MKNPLNFNYKTCLRQLWQWLRLARYSDKCTFKLAIPFHLNGSVMPADTIVQRHKRAIDNYFFFYLSTFFLPFRILMGQSDYCQQKINRKKKTRYGQKQKIFLFYCFNFFFVICNSNIFNYKHLKWFYIINVYISTHIRLNGFNFC